MLTIPTPTTVRPIPEEATNDRHGRKPGAVGVLLDPTVIFDYVHSTLTEHECDMPGDCGSVVVSPLLLLQSPIGEVGVIGIEGVGKEVPGDAPAIPMYVSIGWEYELVDVPAEVVQRAITDQGADVAGFVRLFGDRLDNNAYIWRRFAGA